MSAARPDGWMSWLEAPLRAGLGGGFGHALLLHGPAGVGQFELALEMARGWLCEDTTLPVEQRPCGECAACRLLRARSHPDLLVLVPQALREALGWVPASDEGSGDDGGSKKKKPSKEIRVEEVRAANSFAATTSARGRPKVVVVHPAERMNDIAANAFLKTLEEPPGNARFLLACGAADSLLPTIRSRCQAISLPLPPEAEAAVWLEAQGVADAAVMLAAAGGRPAEALARAKEGVDARAWAQLPRHVRLGEARALEGWPLPWLLDALQRLCDDAARVAGGAPPRYFPAAEVPAGTSVAALVEWSKELTALARDVEHPWNAGLATDALVQRGREALQTPRSEPRPGRPARP